MSEGKRAKIMKRTDLCTGFIDHSTPHTSKY